MYEILSGLVRILAPITCFTAEEIWKYMKHKKGESTVSVMLEYYPKVNPKWDDKVLDAKWDKIIDVKEAVAKVLEEARAEKKIGLSLEASVTITADGKDYEFLNEEKDLLKDVCIVSELLVEKGKPVNKADIKSFELEATVKEAEGEKCSRCWMITKDVNSVSTYPGVCKRCGSNLE